MEILEKPIQPSFQNVTGYRAISLGFYYPNESPLMRLKELIEETLRLETASYGYSWNSLRPLLSLIPLPVDQESVEKLKNLQQEHFRLFGPNPLVPLELAHFFSENPFEQSKKMADASGFYRAFGVSCQNGNRMDNISVAFEFLSYLHLKLMNAYQKQWFEQTKITQDAIHSFLNDFLCPGVNAFQKQLAEKSNSKFYTLLGKISLESIIGGVK